MIRFNVLNWIGAHCAGVSKREEFHGEDMIDAMTIRVNMHVSCMQLDEWFGKDCRLQWYEDPKTKTLDGIKPQSTDLRSELFPGPHKMAYEGSAYIVSMRRGAGFSDQMTIELLGADLKKFSLDPQPGGSCVLSFNVNISGLDVGTMGIISGMGGRDIEIMCAPPAMQEGTVPDGQRSDKRSHARKPKEAANQLRIDDDNDSDHDIEESIELIDDVGGSKDATALFLEANNAFDRLDGEDTPTDDDDEDSQPRKIASDIHSIENRRKRKA